MSEHKQPASSPQRPNVSGSSKFPPVQRRNALDRLQLQQEQGHFRGTVLQRLDPRSPTAQTGKESHNAGVLSIWRTLASMQGPRNPQHQVPKPSGPRPGAAVTQLPAKGCLARRMPTHSQPVRFQHPKTPKPYALELRLRLGSMAIVLFAGPSVSLCNR